MRKILTIGALMCVYSLFASEPLFYFDLDSSKESYRTYKYIGDLPSLKTVNGNMVDPQKIIESQKDFTLKTPVDSVQKGERWALYSGWLPYRQSTYCHQNLQMAELWFAPENTPWRFASRNTYAWYGFSGGLCFFIAVLMTVLGKEFNEVNRFHIYGAVALVFIPFMWALILWGLPLAVCASIWYGLTYGIAILLFRLPSKEESKHSHIPGAMRTRKLKGDPDVEKTLGI